MFQELINFVNSRSLEDVLKVYPLAEDFLINFRLNTISKKLPLLEAIDKVDEESLTEFGLDKFGILIKFCEFIETFTKDEASFISVKSITIKGGFNKSKEREDINLVISTGEVISIVGPTGSGKSRLLSDIECLAQADTPTGRKILINGSEVNELNRFEMEGKLVAQLTQNMNFIMDLSAIEFLKMHAKSRLTPDSERVIENCFKCANDLAGEKFSGNTKVTQLSGGQSRALMIADTAFMSESPIILIDEIENAGIDRLQAIKLLSKKDKIIFISTHDPLIALSADKRIIIKNGGINNVIEISDAERQSLEAIEKLDNILMMLRSRLREGKIITEDLLSN
jgi:ABC-type lipoprotein export system ATPase subunit